MDTELLEKTARELVAPGRGILAADESNGTMSNRLEAVGVEPSPEPVELTVQTYSLHQNMNLQLVVLFSLMRQSVKLWATVQQSQNISQVEEFTRE